MAEHVDFAVTAGVVVDTGMPAVIFMMDAHEVALIPQHARELAELMLQVADEADRLARV